MAKFIMDEEGRHIMSGDRYTSLHTNKGFDNTNDKVINYTFIKEPSGRCNEFKLNKISPYDLLIQIQNNIESKCVIRSITGSHTLCPYYDPDVTEAIRKLIGSKIDYKVRTMCPKKKEESDENYEIRLLYWYMEMFYHDKLKSIRCETCIRKWLLSDKWY
jgi:hypothetical protein